MFKDINKFQQDIIDAEKKANPEAFKLIDSLTQSKIRGRSRTNRQTDKAMDLLSFTSGPDDYSNFTPEQAQENIFNQLMHQNKAMEQRGYKYPNPNDLTLLYTNMSKDLANSGIKDIRQLSVDEVENVASDVKIRYGKDNQLYEETTKGLYDKGFTKVKNQKDFFDIVDIDPRSGFDFKKTGGETTAKKRLPSTYVLINKDTGEQVIQGKYAGNATKYDRNQGFRWGNTTSVEGMADHMITFTPDGQPIIYANYHDTKSDLTGLMMVASIATAGIPIAQSVGTAVSAGTAKGLAAKAIGNVIVNGTINELTGNDFFDNVVVSAGMPFVEKGLDIALANGVYGQEFFTNNPGLDDVFKSTAGNAIKNSFVNGFVAMAQGRDIGTAMTRGAISGAARGAFSETMRQFIEPDDLNFITDNTNLTTKNVFDLTGIAFSRGIETSLDGGDFLESFKNTLISGGIGTVTANSMVNNLGDKFKNYPKTFNKIVRTTSGLAELYSKAALEGRDITPEALQMFFIRQGVGQVVEPTIRTGLDKAFNIDKKQTDMVLAKQ